MQLNQAPLAATSYQFRVSRERGKGRKEKRRSLDADLTYRKAIGEEERKAVSSRGATAETNLKLI
jgi:hypothetical protein